MPLVLFTGGAPGVGKSFVLRRLIAGLPIVSHDPDAVLDEIAGGATGEARHALLPRAFEILDSRQEEMIAARRSHVVNTTAADLRFVTGLHERLTNLGFHCAMLVVQASLATALERNGARPHPIPEECQRAKAEALAGNLPALRQLFAPDFWIVDNECGDLEAQLAPIRARIIARLGAVPVSR